MPACFFQTVGRPPNSNNQRIPAKSERQQTGVKSEGPAPSLFEEAACNRVTPSHLTFQTNKPPERQRSTKACTYLFRSELSGGNCPRSLVLFSIPLTLLLQFPFLMTQLLCSGHANTKVPGRSLESLAFWGHTHEEKTGPTLGSQSSNACNSHPATCIHLLRLP